MWKTILLFPLLFSFDTEDIRAHPENKGVDTIRYFFSGGQVSAIEISHEPGDLAHSPFHAQEVQVFNQVGEMVFRGFRRKICGHSSIHLEFHANGGVHRILTSEAPDAGIQWYKSVWMLDEQGNLISKEERSHEDLERIIIRDDNL